MMIGVKFRAGPSDDSSNFGIVNLADRGGRATTPAATAAASGCVDGSASSEEGAYRNLSNSEPSEEFVSERVIPTPESRFPFTNMNPARRQGLRGRDHFVLSSA